MRLQVVLILIGVILSASCSNLALLNTQDPAKTLRLVGGAWSLVKIQSMDDSVFTPESPDLYTLQFFENGQVQVRADCNRGHGTWQTDGGTRLSFAAIATTRAQCGPESLHDRFLNDLDYVRSYTVQNGNLYLATMADGAILEFWQFDLPEPVAAPEKKPQAVSSRPKYAVSPSFDCAGSKGEVAKAICASAELSGLDRRLQSLYKRALKTAPADQTGEIKAFQKGWIKGRDDCWKATDLLGCVTYEYESRITQLQIRVGEKEVPAPVTFYCADGASLELYFYNNTQLPALMLNRHPEQLLLFRVPTGSGARYEGANVSLWEKAGSAILDWRGEQVECQVNKKA